MQKISQIDRSNSMGQEYNVTDVPKSGFNLTYNSHPAGLVIGRLYPNAYQHIMPADKFSGRNEFSLIAEPLSTPVVSDVSVSQHNFFVTYRSIDSGFEDLLTPTKLNSMSAGLSVPSFSLYAVTSLIFGAFFEYLPEFIRSNASSPWIFNSAPDTSMFSVNNMRTALSSLRNSAKNMYIDDAYEDLFKQVEVFLEVISAKAQSNEVTIEDYKNLWYCIFDFFCGEGSMMDYLGYPIMKHNDVSTLFDAWVASGSSSAWKASNLTGDVTLHDLALNINSDWVSVISNIAPEPISSDNVYYIDKRSLSEYAIRAMYAIWFEYYRVNELEPRSANLPEYRKWGSTPLISTMQDGFLNMLILRTRSWTKDPFTTAQIDDISRHVYAPVISSTDFQQSKFATPAMPAQANPSANSDHVGNLLSQINLTYVDTFGVEKTINCPVPDALSSMDLNYNRLGVSAQNYALDLFTMKKAKMLENYLKRNLAFGDEYRDRMKAHYDVEIADYRINRPEYLSGSVNEMAVQQEVANSGMIKQGANASDEYVRQGERLATATVGSGANSDGFEFFATEFGIYISLLSIIPRAQYDYTCPQHFMLKTVDFPLPEFAAQQEDIMNSSEIYRLGLARPAVDNKPFGHVPYAHPYRYRVDEVHGQTLSSKFDYTFCRFYKGLTADGTPKLNYQFIHCRPNIPMFVNQILLDGQFYGSCKHHFLVERELTQPVETI